MTDPLADTGPWEFPHDIVERERQRKYKNTPIRKPPRKLPPRTPEKATLNFGCGTWFIIAVLGFFLLLWASLQGNSTTDYQEAPQHRNYGGDTW